MNDLKFALRQLLKNPGFAVVALLSLAPGIDVNKALLSVSGALMFFPALTEVYLREP